MRQGSSLSCVTPDSVRAKAPHRHYRVALLLPLSRGYTQGIVSAFSSYVRTHTRWVLRLEDPTANPNLDGLAEWGADGCAGYLLSPTVTEKVLKLRKPVVNLSGKMKVDVPSVLVHDLEVGRLAAKYLLSRGFRNFGFCGCFEFHFSKLRFQGFSEALRDAGFSCAQLHVNMDWEDSLSTPWPEKEGPIRQWLTSLPKPVAVLANNDALGRDISAICFNAEIRVPHEVALLGVDNDETFCNLATPTLSSIATDREEMGHQAAALLERLLAGDAKAEKEHLLIPPKGVRTRQSTDIVAVDDPELALALELIREHADQPFNVEDLLRRLPVSRRSLERRFRASLGRTPLDEIHRVKVERAKELLASTDLTLSAIAARLGFSCLDRLRLVFKDETGVSPNAYRQQYRQRVP
jgi:LacI family transcriptional regulator